MVTCNNKDLPFAALFSGLILSSGDGNALRMVEVDTTGMAPYYDCTKIDEGQTVEDILRPLIGLNGNSKPALRIGKSTDCTPDTNAATCSTKDMSMVDYLRSMVYVNGDGEQFLLVCLEEL